MGDGDKGSGILQSSDNPESFIDFFSAGKQVDIQRDRVSCFFGPFPTLQEVNCAYKDYVAEKWLITQLDDLNKFSMQRDQMEVCHYDILPAMIMDKYSYLKVTEIMLFFWEVKCGSYGCFYNKIEPARIMDMLWQFVTKTRQEAVRQREQEAIRKYEEYRHQNEVADPERLRSILTKISSRQPEQKNDVLDSEDESAVMLSAMNFLHNSSLTAEVKEQMAKGFVARYGCSPEEFVSKHQTRKEK